MEMMLADWAATILCAKVFAGVARRDFGVAPDSVTLRRSRLTVDVAYLWLLAVFSVGGRWIGLDAALGLAILLRLSALLSSKLLIAANHHFIELGAMVLLLRLHHTPAAAAAVVQISFVSIWVYAALQKLYHGQFVDGSFFYILFQGTRGSERWAAMSPWVGRIDAYYAAINRAGLTRCRRLAVAAVAMEIAAPIAAFGLSGTWWSLAILMVSSMAIAYMSGETSFMITNFSLAMLFLLPFDRAALGVLTDPLVASILGYFLLWPPLHAVMTKHLRISPWKLGGWGMYATIPLQVNLVGSQGELIRPTAASSALLVLETFGACKLSWLRTYAQRVFLHWHQDVSGVRGFVLQGYRRRDDRYVTEALVYPNGHTVAASAFILEDEAAITAFQSALKSLSAGDVKGDHVRDGMVTLDTDDDAMLCSPLPNCVIKDV